MIRGNYKKIEQIDRERIIRSYEQGHDIVHVAHTLDIKPQTARSIIKVFVNDERRNLLPKGGANAVKVNEEMVRFFVEYTQANPAITLREIRLRMRNEHANFPDVCEETISRHLDGQLITTKILRMITPDWNRPDVKLLRREYAQWKMEIANHDQLVFVDECGFNLWTSRTKGRSPVGQRAVRIVNRQRGANLTVCIAVSPRYGLVHYMFVRGGMTKIIFAQFVNELSGLITPYDATIVLDNARPHKKITI